jgi:PhnB protein
MGKKVNAQPEGYNTVMPYLIVEGADKLADFLIKVFNADEKERLTSSDGKILHSEYKIGDSIVMISEATENYKPNPTMLYVYVDDVDSVYKKALDAGATSVREPYNEYYGDRTCMVTEASSNKWSIATHVENVTMEEMEKRAREAREAAEKIKLLT